MVNATHPAKVLSTSWGQCEPEMDRAQQATETNLFAQAASQGQTVVAAAGDSGSSDCYYPPRTRPTCRCRWTIRLTSPT